MRVCPIVIVALALFVCSVVTNCSQDGGVNPNSDVIPPNSIRSLSAHPWTSTSVGLFWRASRDSGNGDRCAEYDIRYSTSPISESNWGSAFQCTQNLVPKQPDGAETLIVVGLLPKTTYYFALKTSDEASNWSEISGVESATTFGYTFVTRWGSQGTGEGQFIYPRGIAVDPSANVYVADTYNNRVQKFTSDGSFIRAWGTRGQLEGEFDLPIGLATDTSGNLYVADSGNHRIQKFSADGEFLRVFGDSTVVHEPLGIAVDAQGYIYVADITDRVVKLDADGHFVKQWYGHDQPLDPYGVAVSASGYVYVTSCRYDEIQKFTSSGSWVSTWAAYNFNFRCPKAIAIDAQGNVYAENNSYWCSAIRISSSGQILDCIARFGNTEGTVGNPQAMAVDDSGNLYLTYQTYHYVDKFCPVQ